MPRDSQHIHRSSIRGSRPHKRRISLRSTPRTVARRLNPRSRIGIDTQGPSFSRLLSSSHRSFCLCSGLLASNDRVHLLPPTSTTVEHLFSPKDRSATLRCKARNLERFTVFRDVQAHRTPESFASIVGGDLMRRPELPHHKPVTSTSRRVGLGRHGRVPYFRQGTGVALCANKHALRASRWSTEGHLRILDGPFERSPTRTGHGSSFVDGPELHRFLFTFGV